MHLRPHTRASPQLSSFPPPPPPLCPALVRLPTLASPANTVSAMAGCLLLPAVALLLCLPAATAQACTAASGYLDGTGTATDFYQPSGLAVDGSGVLYVSEVGARGGARSNSVAAVARRRSGCVPRPTAGRHRRVHWARP